MLGVLWAIVQGYGYYQGMVARQEKPPVVQPVLMAEDPIVPSQDTLTALRRQINLPATSPQTNASDLEYYETKVLENEDLHALMQSGEYTLTSVELTERFMAVRNTQAVFEAYQDAYFLLERQAELVALTKDFDREFYRLPPYERLIGVQGPLLTYVPEQTIYPNIQSVVVILNEAIFSLVDPENVSEYQNTASRLLDELVIAGMVTQSDVVASRLLVEQYLEIYNADEQFLQVIEDLAAAVGALE